MQAAKKLRVIFSHVEGNATIPFLDAVKKQARHDTLFYR